MGKKLGIYFSDESASLLDGMGEASTSAIVNSLLSRYRWMCQQSLPELSDGDWQTLLNVYAGCEMVSHPMPVRIASDILDEFGALELAELEPEVADLARLARDWTQAEQLAVLDFCQRYWSQSWDGKSFDAVKKTLA